jgi:hypothetical protein
LPHRDQQRSAKRDARAKLRTCADHWISSSNLSCCQQFTFFFAHSANRNYHPISWVETAMERPGFTPTSAYRSRMLAINR